MKKRVFRNGQLNKVATFLLLNGRMPSDCNHQIDGVVNGNDIADEFIINFESAQKSFANSGDESCRIASKSEIMKVDKTLDVICMIY